MNSVSSSHSNLTRLQCVRLNFHKARSNCVYFEHLYCTNRSRSSLTEANATETVGTGERSLYTGISREVGVHGINYLRYDLHYTEQRARGLLRVVRDGNWVGMTRRDAVGGQNRGRWQGGRWEGVASGKRRKLMHFLCKIAEARR